MVEKLPMNLARNFWRHLTHNESVIVLERLEPDGMVSWRQSRSELRQEAAQWMAALQAAGVGPGDRVAVSLGKSSGLVTAHLAILGVGAGVVPLNPALTARETEAVLQRAQVKLAISHRETIARAPEILNAVHGPWWIVGDTKDMPSSAMPISQVLPTATSRLEPVECSDDDLALLVFTSGTTGTPKGVGLTHRNVRANLQALLVDTWEMVESDRLLHTLPPHHVHGLGLGLYGTLYVGNAAVLLERFDPVVVLRAFGPQRISVFMGVPTMYHRMTEAVDADPHLKSRVSVASMRVFTCGSAPLSPETFRRFREQFGFAIVERYGLTETVINTSNPLRGPWKPGSVGLPLPGVEVGIFDPQTLQRLGTGETGEICVRGPNVFRGYWNNLEATTAAFHGEWFRTGDLGAFDADGYLSILGRIKELIIVGGSNVTPGEVEVVLETDPGVAECAVVGIPDADLGERITAFIVPRAGEETAVLEVRLRAKAERDLAPYKRPRAYRFLDAVPRNAMGKVERNKLRNDKA
jgi:malonyl-CoA/methylmalonyl-CoA synthetase